MNEFDKLLKSPYGSQNQTFSGINGSPMTPNSGPAPTFQTNSAPSFSSFSQIGAAANLGSNISSNTPGVQGSSFGAPSFFGSNSQNFNGSQMKFGTTGVSTPAASGLSFGSTSAMPLGSSIGVSTPAASGLSFGATSAMPFGSSTGVSTPAASGLSFGATSAMPFGSSSMSFGSKVTGSPFASSNQQLSNSVVPNLSPKTVHQSTFADEEDGSDDSIWLKEVWNIGEIPDRPPPAKLCL